MSVLILGIRKTGILISRMVKIAYCAAKCCYFFIREMSFTTVTKYQSDQAYYIFHPINRSTVCFWSHKFHGFDRRSKTAVPVMSHVSISEAPVSDFKTGC